MEWFIGKHRGTVQRLYRPLCIHHEEIGEYIQFVLDFDFVNLKTFLVEFENNVVPWLKNFTKKGNQCSQSPREPIYNALMRRFKCRPCRMP
jgi:hypothetical protein